MITQEIGAIAKLVGGDQLPDDFTMEITDYAMATLEDSDVFGGRLKTLTDELIRMGYQIIYWHDESTMTKKIRCVMP